MAATADQYLKVKPTFHKAPGTRPSFGLPRGRSSVSSVEELAPGRNTVSHFSELKRPSHLDIDSIIKSNDAIEAFLTKIPGQTRSPTEQSVSEASLQHFALPISTTSSRPDIELSRRFGPMETIVPAADLDADDDFDVMCLNCFEFLKVSQANFHSSNCFKTLELSRRKEFEVRLTRLQALTAERVQQSEGQTAAFYEDLLRTMRDIQTSFSGDQMQQVEDMADKANSLAGLLLSKRLINLMVEFSGKVLPSHLTSDDLHAFKEWESSKQGSRLSRWRLHPDRHEDSQEIKEVMSECEEEEDRSIISMYTDNTSPYLEEPLSNRQVSSKKSFYGRCLKIKAKLPKDHPAHQVLISSLYQCSVKEGVHLEQWDSYIKANLGTVD
jgi:hypothetical protein